jgi:hypothetical protein
MRSCCAISPGAAGWAGKVSAERDWRAQDLVRRVQSMTRLRERRLLFAVATPAFAQWTIVKAVDRITRRVEQVACLPAKARVNGVTATSGWTERYSGA